MGKGRLEAFSDGVLAIIITIMVLELKVPHVDDPTALKPLYPVFLSYLLSFIYIGIYWNNHHHLLHMVKHINGKSMWANLHLLFWLSLVPFATAWMGENHFSKWTIILYNAVLIGAAIAYTLLLWALVSCGKDNKELAAAMGKDWKGKLSLVIYLLSTGVAFISTAVSLLLITLVAAIWFIPDKRVEKIVEKQEALYDKS
ncbi:MAG TPA: TMEM175 family protein [Flavipsychrobacter sp.]|nr:TMEM175 family protein [Flavipsychrobacter sp.]